MYEIRAFGACKKAEDILLRPVVLKIIKVGFIRLVVKLIETTVKFIAIDDLAFEIQ